MNPLICTICFVLLCNIEGYRGVTINVMKSTNFALKTRGLTCYFGLNEGENNSPISLSNRNTLIKERNDNSDKFDGLKTFTPMPEDTEHTVFTSEGADATLLGPDQSKNLDFSENEMYFSPEIWAILVVYFVQGALGLSRLAMTYFLKDELGLSPAESSALLGITSLPWIIKPLYGFLSDGVPLLGYKRKSYLILCGLGGCLSWLAMGTVVQDSTQLLAAATIASLTVAFSDVVVDSIAVERSKDSTLLSTKNDANNSMSAAGDLQSLCWASAAIGGICSAYFSGSLLQSVVPRTVFLITSLFPLFTAGASIAISENKFDTRSSAGSTLQDMKLKVQEIFSTLKQPSIYLPVLFVFMWQATPSPDTAMFYFYTSQLGFTPEFLGRLRLVSSIASLLGVLTYRTYLKSVPLKRILFWTAITSVPLGLSQTLLTSHINRSIGIPDDWFTLTDSVVLTVLGQISFMPILALAAALCPPGVEGTLFASLMAIYNAAGTVSSELGAALMSLLNITSSNFDNLTLLIVICSLSSLLPLPFLDTLLGNKLLDKSSAE